MVVKSIRTAPHRVLTAQHHLISSQTLYHLHTLSIVKQSVGSTIHTGFTIMSARTPNVWFITGSSNGFGKEIALAALNRGDKVIATARNSQKLGDLQSAGAEVMDLDVTAPLAELKKIASTAHSKYGSITHLINSAGYILEGAVEETSPEETLAQFNTNVFGMMNVTRAVLPFMRAQKHGVIGIFGSLGSWRGGPAFGNYAATKWACTAIAESLRPEVESFGIEVCSIEPGYFRSGFLNPGARISSKVEIEEYSKTAVGHVRDMLVKVDNNQPGDVAKGAKVIVDVFTKSGAWEGKDVPVRLVLGSDCQEAIRGKCEETIKILDEQREISNSTDYPKGH